MRNAIMLGALAVSACNAAPDAPAGATSATFAIPAANDTTPSALEQAAIRSGIVADTRATGPIGLYQHSHEAGQDILCIVPGEKGRFRFGLQAVFGEDTECRGHGSARRVGDRLILHFERSTCLVVADFEGDRVTLPGVVDTKCADVCNNRGSLEGVSFPRISADARGALAARDRNHKPLCRED